MEGAFGAVEGIRRNFFHRHHKLHLHLLNLCIFSTSASYQQIGLYYKLTQDPREVTTKITTKYFSEIKKLSYLTS